MIPALRARFNESYTPAGYARLLQLLEAKLGAAPGFRVAETPCFLPQALLDRCATIGSELTHQLVSDASYRAAALAAIPADFRMPGLSEHPHFMTADFGLVRDENGTLSPRIVELQAFPSIYAYQAVLCEAYREAYELPAGLGQYLGSDESDSKRVRSHPEQHEGASATEIRANGVAGQHRDPYLGHVNQIAPSNGQGTGEAHYWELLGRTILNGHQPENVILTEVEPERQKTYPDFALTAERVGIRIVDIAKLIIKRVEGAPALVFYRDGDVLVPVHRIYNRAIVDEIVARGIKLPFRYNEPLAVEWAGDPNWYFVISKFSLPYLDHPAVPPAYFLDDWLRRSKSGQLPAAIATLPRSEWILKPLYGFAGRGIEFGPSDAQLAAIPESEQPGFLMQQRMHFEPVIETPFGRTQTEIRILYLWPDGGHLQPALSLTRLGRGKMMGVDHNKDQEWVGGSAAFYIQK